MGQHESSGMSARLDRMIAYQPATSPLVWPAPACTWRRLGPVRSCSACDRWWGRPQVITNLHKTHLWATTSWCCQGGLLTCPAATSNMQ